MKVTRMMRIVYVLAILFLGAQLTVAQRNDNMLLNMGEATSTVITRGRALLLDKFLVGDTSKVKEIETYLNTLSDENYSSFYSVEKWLIDYWTNDL